MADSMSSTKQISGNPSTSGMKSNSKDSLSAHKSVGDKNKTKQKTKKTCFFSAKFKDNDPGTMSSINFRELRIEIIFTFAWRIVKNNLILINKEIFKN
jgi:hypothetical protein